MGIEFSVTTETLSFGKLNPFKKQNEIVQRASWNIFPKKISCDGCWQHWSGIWISILTISFDLIILRFDFASFGAFADIIGQEFFPPNDHPSINLLKALFIFGAAFVMRPIGGVIIGWIGDRGSRGNQGALEISILLMLVPSFLIGCLPPFSVGGWVSPFLLVPDNVDIDIDIDIDAENKCFLVCECVCVLSLFILANSGNNLHNFKC